MKRIFSAIAVLGTLLLTFSCGKPEPQEEVDPMVKLEVVDIDNNCATINVTLTEGNSYGGTLIRMMAQDDVTVDVTNEIQLINFIQANGEDIQVPYHETLTDLKAGKKVFTAVIVYDKDGRASSCDYAKWETVGNPDGWSTNNGAGDITENIW